MNLDWILREPRDDNGHCLGRVDLRRELPLNELHVQGTGTDLGTHWEFHAIPMTQREKENLI